MTFSTIDRDGALIYRSSLHYDKESISPDQDSLKGDEFVDILFISVGFRIDNRKELQFALNLSENTDRETLLIASWRAWREGMADRLRGSFAFALRDSIAGKVYLARDSFGLSPLYYHSDEEHLIVGGSCRVVRSLLAAKPSENKLMLADFISGAVLESEQTFFEGIFRLPPAHWMMVDQKQLTKQQYWSISDAPRDQPHENVPQHFRKLFDQSVENCFVDKKTALLLSGGLDSSAIAGSLNSSRALGFTIPCLTMTYHQTHGWCDEEHLMSLSNMMDLTLHELPSDDHNPLDDMEHWLTVMDGPYLPYGHSVSIRCLSIAKKLGYPYILSGHGGDEIVSHGLGRLNELAKQGKWFKLWQETKAASRIYGDHRGKVFRKYLNHIPIIRFVKSKLKRHQTNISPVSKSYLSDSLQQEIEDSRYVQKSMATRRDHDERMLHEDILSLPLQPLSLEVFALCSEASGVQTRFPFYDRDLTNYSLSLPSHWKLRDGLSRFIMREAMAGDLPEKLLKRQDKFDFANNFLRGLLSDRDKLMRLTDPEIHDLAGFVNVPLLSALRQKLAVHGSDLEIVDGFFLWRVAILSMWLKISSIHPTGPDLEPLGEGLE